MGFAGVETANPYIAQLQGPQLSGFAIGAAVTFIADGVPCRFAARDVSPLLGRNH